MAALIRVGSWPTLAASDTASQLPPVRVKRPLPIRLRISSGVSSGPLANGVKLEQLRIKRKNDCGCVFSFYVLTLSPCPHRHCIFGSLSLKKNVKKKCLST